MELRTDSKNSSLCVRRVHPMELTMRVRGDDFALAKCLRED